MRLKKIGREIVDGWLYIPRTLKANTWLLWFLLSTVGTAVIIVGYLFFLAWTIDNGIWYIGLLVVIPLPFLLERFIGYCGKGWM